MTLLAPICPHNKAVCMAFIFQSYADTRGRTTYPLPHYFLNATSSVVGPNEVVVIPKAYADEVFYGTELTLVLGRSGKSIAESEAMDYV